MKQITFGVYKGLTWIIFAVAVTQFFFAGLGVFEATSFDLHAIVGLLLVPTSLLLLIVAVIGGFARALSWSRVGLTALLFVLMFVQFFLGGPAQDISPFVAALHPVNGLLLLLLSYTLARGRRLAQIAEGGAVEQETKFASRVR